MPQEFQVLKCYSCNTFQVEIMKKKPKWECKICHEKQSVKQVFMIGTSKDCRMFVQNCNENLMKLGESFATCESTREVETHPRKQELCNFSQREAKSKWLEFLPASASTEMAPDIKPDDNSKEKANFTFSRPTKKRKKPAENSESRSNIKYMKMDGTSQNIVGASDNYNNDDDFEEGNSQFAISSQRIMKIHSENGSEPTVSKIFDGTTLRFPGNSNSIFENNPARFNPIFQEGSKLIASKEIIDEIEPSSKFSEIENIDHRFKTNPVKLQNADQNVSSMLKDADTDFASANNPMLNNCTKSENEHVHLVKSKSRNMFETTDDAYLDSLCEDF